MRGKIKFKDGYVPGHGSIVPPYIRGIIASGQLEGETMEFPKHSSVTVADIGKLMMVDVDYDNMPPAGVDEIHATAIVANPIDYVPGTKAQTSFTIPFVEQPLCKNVNILISCVPTAGQELIFSDDTALTSWTVGFVNGAPGVSEIQVDGGATTLSIANDLSALMTTATYGANQVVTDNGDGTVTLNVDLLLGDTTAGFTNSSSWTTPACITITMVSDHTSTDVYNTALGILANDVPAVESMISGSSWTGNGADDHTLLRYDDLFAVASGNPNGSAGYGFFTDMLFYTDETEYALGITWAIGNNSSVGSGYSSEFSAAWTLISSVAGTENAVLTIETNTPPFGYSQSETFNLHGELQPDIIIINVVEGLVQVLPAVVGQILGVLVGVHEDTATIHTGHTQYVKLHEESVYGTIPISNATYIASQNPFPGVPWVLAWKDGTVIDYPSFIDEMQALTWYDDGTQGAVFLTMLGGGMFTTYDIGLGGSYINIEKSLGYYSLFLGLGG